MRWIFLPVVLLFTWYSSAADLPPNSHTNVYGNGWDCDRGYYKSGQGCKKVVVPENASIDVYGSGWACNRGYYKSGQGCKKVIVPENASIDVYGSGWACNRGYYKYGQGCKKVIVPENASIDVYGSGWACNSGFKKSGSSCTRMTQEELKKQKAFEAAVAAEMQRRKTQGVSGDVCDTEYKSGAQVCLEISDADIECNKSYMGEFYRDCEVEVDYELTTDYRGQSSINVDVECEAEISYKARESRNSSDSDDESESHSLYANGSDYGSIDIDFSFSSYKEVYSVKLESVECELSSVDLW